MINDLCAAAHENAKEKGFYEVEPSIPERLCLIHEEVSEALQADRKGIDTNLEEHSIAELLSISTKKDNAFKNVFGVCVKGTFEDELADICIRVFDLAAHQGIDLESHIKAKMRYNKMRPYKHGKKY